MTTITDTGSTKASFVSDLAKAKSGLYIAQPASLQFENDGRITQTERLFTARPRYTPSATSAADLYGKSIASRGTSAYIKLLTSNKQALSYATTRGVREGDDLTGPGSIVSRMVDGNSDLGYDEFLITGVNCQLQEKLQVTETFGDGEVAYYFGRQPVMFTISGALIDSPDNSWFTNWIRMYSSVLRGSQLAQNHELLRLVLPNMTLTGTISGMSWDQNSGNDVQISFSFQFMAKRIDPTAPVLQNVSADALGGMIDFTKAANFLSQQQLNSFKSQVAQLESVVKSPNATITSIGAALGGLGSGIGGSLGSVKGTGALQGVSDDLSKWVTTNGFSAGLRDAASTGSGLFSTLTANLAGIRAQFFSPIYGILTSLTKLVRNTFGDVTKIFNNLFSPIRTVLRDITTISNQAINLVNLVNSSIRGLGRTIQGQIAGTRADFDKAMKSLGKAAGSIATSPQTVLQSVQSMFQGGAFGTNPPFLQENSKASLSSAASIGAGGSRKNYKIAILQGSPAHTAAAGAKL